MQIEPSFSLLSVGRSTTVTAIGSGSRECPNKINAPRLLVGWFPIHFEGGGGDEEKSPVLRKMNAVLTVLYLIIPKNTATICLGSARVSTGFTGSLEITSKTQESGDGPEISPPSETAPIGLKKNRWGNFWVGITNHVLRFPKSFVRPSYR